MPVDRQRRAYVCVDKEGQVIHRVFLHAGDAEPAVCSEHGKMIRQTNMPYTEKAKTAKRNEGKVKAQ